MIISFLTNMNTSPLLVFVLCLSVEQQMALDSFRGKVAVVTGASSGIGKAIAIELVKKGMHVVGLARREQLMQNLSASLGGEPGKLYPVKCDVTVEKNVLSAFKWIQDKFGKINVLVNSAGVAYKGNLITGATSNWTDILYTNVLGLSICSREAIRNMMKCGVNDGQIININSDFGHWYNNIPGMEMYGASKFTVTTITEGLRRELVREKSSIRVTSLSPGTVNTPLLQTIAAYTDQKLVESTPKLEPIDIANAVLCIMRTPPNVQVAEMFVIPIGTLY